MAGARHSRDSLPAVGFFVELASHGQTPRFAPGVLSGGFGRRGLPAAAACRAAS